MLARKRFDMFHEYKRQFICEKTENGNNTVPVTERENRRRFATETMKAHMLTIRRSAHGEWVINTGEMRQGAKETVKYSEGSYVL